MKLISMTEFVLSKTTEIDTTQYQDAWLWQNVNILKEIENYAQFLSHPLTLGMFVPCDLEGNLLSSPDPISIGDKIGRKLYEPIYDNKEVCFYNEAKERVLFEGCEITHLEGRLTGKNHLEFETVKGVFYWDLVNKKFMIEGDIYDHELKTIEDLVGFDLTLTQSAITKIKGV